MTCEIRVEAYKLIHHLQSHVPEGAIAFEMRSRIQKFLMKVHTLSEMNVHEIDEEVYLDPHGTGKYRIPCKIVNCYRSSDGRVVYDLAVQLGFNENGVPRYGEETPLRDVVPSYFRLRKDVDALPQSQQEAMPKNDADKVFSLTQ
jgi:hypothetical protein